MIVNENDFSSFRINKEGFINQINENKLYQILIRFNKKSLTKNVTNFLNWIKNA